MAGHQDQFTTIIFMDVPLRIAVPKNISRCPGTIMPLLNGPLAIGGAGNIDFDWGDINGEPSNLGIDLDDDDNGTPEHPLLIIPVGYAGTITISYLITDGNGCPTDGTLTVTVSSMSVDAGPDEVIACNSGPGTHRLGPVIATGGGGEYTYTWSPSDYLDDAGSPNPLIELPVGASGLEYNLTVSDGYGCSLDAGPVNVIEASASPVVNAGEDQIVCYNTATTIGHNDEGQEYIWTSTNPAFPGSQEPNPEIPDEINRDGQTHTYTVWAIDSYSGCYAEDEMNLKALSQWKYTGYESEVIFALKGGLAALWEGTDNSIITADEAQTLGIVSGATPPFTYSWLEPVPPYDVSPVLNAENIPGGGTFRPLETRDMLTLHVADSYGCTKDFKSNRVLVLDDEPEVEIRVVSPSSPVVCSGDNICFNILLRTNYDGLNHWLLPQQITANYAIKYENTLEVIETDEEGSLVLNLVNAEDGVYVASLCYNTQAPPEVMLYSFLEIWGELPTSEAQGLPPGLLDIAFSGIHHFQIVNSGTASGYDEICYETFANAIELAVNPGNNCPDLILPGGGGNYFKYKWTGGTDGYVTMDGYMSVNAYLHAFLSQCLTEQEISPEGGEMIVEKTSEPPSLANKIPVEAGLEIYPNPFSGEVTVRYTVQAEEGEEVVTIRVVDIMGSVVKILKSKEVHPNGTYSLTFSGHHLVNGTYYFDMTTNKHKVVQRLVKMD